MGITLAISVSELLLEGNYHRENFFGEANLHITYLEGEEWEYSLTQRVSFFRY